MSAKTKRIERGQRFRRLRRGANRARAVSPVVATLILILIAVAAAAALYLWLVVWQGHLTGGIGNPSAQSEVTIGGSTSVYPFSSAAVSWFEQNNTDVVVSDTQGGTGAGMDAVCAGNIDVGAASFLVTPEILETTYGCTVQPGITATTIAFDAVDVIVSGSNPHGLLSISYDTMNAIYETASTSKPTCDTTTLFCLDTINGVTSPVTLNYNTPLTWDQIPAMVEGASTPTTGSAACGTTALTEGLAAGVAADGSTGQAAGTGACANDIVTPTTDDSPCGFTVCAGPYVATPTAGQGPEAPIVPISRSDASGTTQTFEAKILGYGVGTSSSPTTFATSYQELAYSGCGSNNVLADCGFTYSSSQEGLGNPGVIALVGAPSGNNIGYASDGLARASGSGVAIVPFLAVGQSATTTGASTGIVDTATLVYGGVLPTTGASGTIAQGVIGGGGSNIGTVSATVDQYAGWRPFEFVTLQPPAGEVERLIQFITEPAVNGALASYTAEVGIYQV